jgi:hypothetical protein
MTDIDHLMQQNILEHESRLKHLDELVKRARNKIGKGPEHSSWLAELRLKRLENWRVDEIEKAGPMGIWDAVGQQLEKLVERIER